MKSSWTKSYILVLLSCSIWFIGFGTRFLQDKEELYHLEKNHNKINEFQIAPGIARDVNFEIFKYVLKTNTIVLLISIGSFATFGIGTAFLLFTNGLSLANSMLVANKNGLPLESFTRYVLPHSFEIIGLWISGAISFKIVYYLINFLRFQQFPTRKEFIHIAILASTAFIITLTAAFVEAYITFYLINEK